MSKKPPQSEQNTNGTQSPETTAGEQPYRPVAKRVPQATYKQREFARLVSSGTGKSEAYRQAYSSKGTDGTVATEARRTLKLPSVKIELAKYNDSAKSMLLKVLEEAEKRLPGASDRDVSPLMTVAERTANSIIDRVDGKSVQRVQVQSTAVNITLDLSGAAPPTEVTPNK